MLFLLINSLLNKRENDIYNPVKTEKIERGFLMNEFEKRLQRLRDRYKEFGEKYGKKRFNIELFEQRYKNALLSRENLEIFITAEEEALTQLYQETLSPKNTVSDYEKSFMKKVDDIIEEYDSRIKQYPYIDFHPDANEELKYLYGAIRQFYENIFPLLEMMFGTRDLGVNVMKDFSGFYGFIDYFARERSNRYSRRIEDYLIKLKHYSATDTEQNYRNIMIESAQYFNKLSIFLQKQKENIKNIDRSLSVPYEFFGKETLSYIEIVDYTLQWIDDLFYNFRIKSFI